MTINPSEAKARDTMIALAQFYEVQHCLQKLVTYNIVKPEAVLKGLQKFLREHPIIKEHLETELGNVHTQVLANMPRPLKQHLEKEYKMSTPPSQPQLQISKPDPRLRFKLATQDLMDAARRFRSVSDLDYETAYKDLQEEMYEELYAARIHALEEAALKVRSNWIACKSPVELCALIRGMA